MIDDPQMKESAKKLTKEEREIEKAVDKELEDLIFLHRSQGGKQISLD